MSTILNSTINFLLQKENVNFSNASIFIIWTCLQLKARAVQQGETTRREYSVTTAATNGGEQWSLVGAISYELSPGRRLQRLPDALNYSLQLSGPASSGWTAANGGTVVHHTLSWQQQRSTGDGLSSSFKASFEIPSSVPSISLSSAGCQKLSYA